jgi:hypothetical protein
MLTEFDSLSDPDAQMLLLTSVASRNEVYTDLYYLHLDLCVM